MGVMETIKKMKGSVAMPRTAEAEQEVEFMFSAPGAKNVSLAGNFNEWNMSSLPMKKGKDGTWRKKLKLPQGEARV